MGVTKRNRKINSLVGKQADSPSFSFAVIPSWTAQPPSTFFSPLAISCPELHTYGCVVPFKQTDAQGVEMS